MWTPTALHTGFTRGVPKAGFHYYSIFLHFYRTFWNLFISLFISQDLSGFLSDIVLLVYAHEDLFGHTVSRTVCPGSSDPTLNI